jgi:phosphoribosyl 1,2-cyclic phosphodiesterase
MRVAVLGSGSSGNAVVVASGKHRLLIDAGFSCRQVEQRLGALGERACAIGALLLTHEHGDHVRGAVRLARRHQMPIYATAGTLRGAHLVADTLPFEDRPKLPASHVVRSGHPFEVAGFHVEAFAVPHDAAEPVGFVVEDEEGNRLGLASDLGCRSQLAWGRLHDLDCLILETNHDLTMLREGPYPWHLKQRVAGRHGHLSNEDAAAGLAELLSDRLQTVVLYHLSRTNNLPALALDTVGERLDRERASLDLVVSSQFQPTPWIEIQDRLPRNSSENNG